MNTNRIALAIAFLVVLTVPSAFEKALVAQLGGQPDSVKKADQPATRTVKIIAPSISCFSRFEAGLRLRIRDKNDWVHSVRIKALHRKIVMPRPEFDFGNDVEIEFQIDKNQPVKDLAEAMVKQGFSGDSVLTSGHKMRDFKSVSLKDLIKKTD